MLRLRGSVYERVCSQLRHCFSFNHVVRRNILVSYPYSAVRRDNKGVNDKSSSAVSTRQEVKMNSDGSAFSGSIPLDDLQITCSRSSGPGGQNVNKVNSKVEVRFHVGSAKWIPVNIKTKLIEREAGRITKDGYLVVSSEKTRRQQLNQADCIDRIRTMISDAANDKPYEPSPEQLALLHTRLEKARTSTLREKRKHSEVKRNRRAPSVDSFT